MGLMRIILLFLDMKLNEGRNFSPDEIQQTRHYVIIGADIVKDLFPSGVDPLG